MTKFVMMDDRMESYRTFFDHEWAREIDEAARGTPLEDAVFGLCMAWKQAANTHCMPYILVRGMKTFADALCEGLDPAKVKLLDAIAERLIREVGDLRHMQRVRLNKALQTISSQVRDQVARETYEFNDEAYFQEISRLSEFQLCLTGSQRLCYAALYHAYEHFLLRVYKLVKGIAKYRIPRGGFSRDFEAALGKAVSDYCCTDKGVNVARLARNALAHNGGQMTDELRGKPYTFQVVGDEIQIMPCDTKALFDLLKVRAMKLTVEAIPKLPTVP